MTIGERWQALSGRPAGFDYLRIILASAVVLWHSYQVSYGTMAAITFWSDTPFGLLLQLILPAFFSLSGFLVAGSMYRNRNLSQFLALRVIRIFPALVVEVFLAALLLGPLVTSLELRHYIADQEFHVYFLNTIGYIHYLLPGVFEHNTEQAVVNSQLWTVPYELECYIFISVIFLLGFFSNRSRVLPLFILITVFIAIWSRVSHVEIAPAGGDSGRLLVLCFLAGVVVYAYRDVIPWRIELAICAIIGATLAPKIGHGLAYLVPICSSYLTVYLGLLNPRRTIIVLSGDYSYGLYLYSCPIQQAVEQYTGHPHSYALNVLLSFPVTAAFALFSWWCIEKPFLEVRRLLRSSARHGVEGSTT